MLQISCNLITSFHHCLTSIYCIERSGAINNEPVRAFVYLCQALSAGMCSVKYGSPLSRVCSPQSEVCSQASSQFWLGGRLALPSSLMWTERLREIGFGSFLAFHVCSLLTCGNRRALSITCLQFSSTSSHELVKTQWNVLIFLLSLQCKKKWNTTVAPELLSPLPSLPELNWRHKLLNN